MFVFRRLSEKDTNFSFLTGNEAFDEINKEGNVQVYIQQDSIKGGHYVTYLLLQERENTNAILLGLIRYKFTNFANFKKDLIESGTSKDIQDRFAQKLSEKQFSIIYLSRIGVVEKFQDMRLSKVLNILFEFIIKERRENVLIYAKFVEKLRKIMALAMIL